jgi:hypothetical protein
MRSTRFAIVVAALPLLINPASAAMVYSFGQTGPTIATGAQYGPDGPNEVFTTGSFTLADSIVRAPYRLGADNNAPNPGPATPPRGLLDIFFATFDRGRAVVGDLPRFVTPNRSPSNGQYYSLALTGEPGSLFPTGTVSYNDSESNTDLVLGPDGRVSGVYSTDRGGPCFTSGACAFTGRLTASHVPNPRPAAVPVPEPMSLALFGMGLGGLAMARRRGRRQAGSGQMKRWRSR